MVFSCCSAAFFLRSSFLLRKPVRKSRLFVSSKTISVLRGLELPPEAFLLPIICNKDVSTLTFCFCFDSQHYQIAHFEPRFLKKYVWKRFNNMLCKQKLSWLPCSNFLIIFHFTKEMKTKGFWSSFQQSKALISSKITFICLEKSPKQTLFFSVHGSDRTIPFANKVFRVGQWPKNSEFSRRMWISQDLAEQTIYGDFFTPHLRKEKSRQSCLEKHTSIMHKALMKDLSRIIIILDGHAYIKRQLASHC